jgi:hypothetical protein
MFLGLLLNIANFLRELLKCVLEVSVLELQLCGKAG